MHNTRPDAQENPIVQDFRGVFRVLMCHSVPIGRMQDSKSLRLRFESVECAPRLNFSSSIGRAGSLYLSYALDGCAVAGSRPA